MNQPSSRHSSQEPRTYLLVHGAFHGGWAWKQVAALLRAKGDNVYAPTLTGLGERSHLLAIRPTLETFIADIVQVIRYEELSDIILVGHSFAGAVVTGVADRYRDRIRSLVYVDAMILQDGQSALDTAPPALIETYRIRAAESGSPTTTPNGPEYYGITDPAQAEWLRGKLTPHPVGTFFDQLRLSRPPGDGLPVTYIAASQPYFESTSSSRSFARSMPNWTYAELPTGHNIMMLMPEALADMLAGVP